MAEETILEYAEGEGRTFAEFPFQDVDSLVLCQLAYLHFDAAGLKACALSRYPVTEALYAATRVAEKNRRLFAACAASRRFGDIVFSAYTAVSDYDVGKQFSAVCFDLSDGTRYVAFRGTDSTFLGWKEDFDMTYKPEVPSQYAAMSYLNRYATGRTRVGGHSKGGNLAMYAAMRCNPSTKKQLIAVYCHDGPGFNEDTFARLDFSSLLPILHRIVPKSSVIGMLLDNRAPYQVVKSDGFWLLQHDPYLWLVKDSAFVTEERTTVGSDYLNASLSAWLKSLSDTDREKFSDIVYCVLEKSGAQGFRGFSKIWYKKLPFMLLELKNVDAKMVKQILMLFTYLAQPFRPNGKNRIEG